MVLFDFVTLQHQVYTGSVLYTEKVLLTLLQTSQKVYGIYDSRKPKGDRVEKLIAENNIVLIDILDKNLAQKLVEYKIDVFFIGLLEGYDEIDLKIFGKVKIYIAAHDVNPLAIRYSSILKMAPNVEFQKKQYKASGIKKVLRKVLYPLVLLRRHYREKKEPAVYERLREYIKLDNVFLIAVSEYSKRSIEYFIGVPKNEIEVLYAPRVSQNLAQNKPSEKIIETVKNKKYFLLVSGERLLKNPALVLEQWDKFCERSNCEYYCIITGNPKMSGKRNLIALDYVKPGDLAYLYENAFSLLFPTFAEGFGYPPIEAASFGVPSVCSNVMSVPEICGEMAVYCSPFYPDDLYRAMLEMCENRELYAKKAKKRYEQVNQKQTDDLNKLIKALTN